MSTKNRMKDTAARLLRRLLAELEGEEPDGKVRSPYEAELEAELRRAREEWDPQARRGAGAGPRRRTDPAEDWLRRETQRRQQQQRRARPTPAQTQRAALQKAYAALEVPFGAPFNEVRKAYRQMMRKYHPDRHTGDPGRQRMATDISAQLSQYYSLIKKQHQGK